MNPIAILFIVIVIFSSIVSAKNKTKKQQQKKDAASAPGKPRPAAPVPETDAAQKSFAFSGASGFYSEGEDPCHEDMLTGVPFSRENADAQYGSLFEADQQSEGTASSEGEDPCHESMLTGPAAKERPAFLPGDTGSAELLRGIILSEVLGKPKALRRNG